jgi:hypothetical protein
MVGAKVRLALLTSGFFVGITIVAPLGRVDYCVEVKVITPTPPPRVVKWSIRVPYSGKKTGFIRLSPIIGNIEKLTLLIF